MTIQSLILATSIYLLSLWRCWWWINRAYYNPSGIWKGLTPNSEDRNMAIIPLMNTGVAVFSFFYGSTKKNTPTNFFKSKPKSK